MAASRASCGDISPDCVACMFEGHMQRAIRCLVYMWMIMGGRDVFAEPLRAHIGLTFAFCTPGLAELVTRDGRVQ